MSDSATPWTVAHQVPLCMEFSRQEDWLGCHFLLQGIFPTQGSNLHLLLWQMDSFPPHHLEHTAYLPPIRNVASSLCWNAYDQISWLLLKVTWTRKVCIRDLKLTFLYLVMTFMLIFSFFVYGRRWLTWKTSLRKYIYIPFYQFIVMHRARISKPTERVNKSTVVMQRQEGNFYF